MTDAPAAVTGRPHQACPACGAGLSLPRDAVLAEIFFCDECGMELELVSLDPQRLQPYEEEEK